MLPLFPNCARKRINEMKKRISIGELKEYLEENKPTRIFFHAENQAWYNSADHFASFRTMFSEIMVYEYTPCLIGLKSETNTISFNCIKSVEIDTESSILGTIITLFCGSHRKVGHDTTYRVVAEYRDI